MPDFQLVVHAYQRFRNSPATLSILIIALMTMIMLGAIPPLEKSLMSTPYQSYRASILAATSFGDSGMLAATPTKTDPKTYYRFEELTNDDLGYPLILTFAISTGVVSIPTDQIDLFRTTSGAISRDMMRQTFSETTYKLGYYFYYLTFFMLCLLLVFTSRHNSRQQCFVIVFGVAGACAPFLLTEVFTRVLHSHSLIPGLVPLTLALPVAAMQIKNSFKSWKNYLWLAFIALDLTAILLVRKSTGLIVGLSLAAYLLFLRSAWRHKMLAVGGIAAGLFLYTLSPILLDIQRSLMGQGEMISHVDTGSNVGHPIYHALLYGLSIDPENSLGVRTEQDVIRLVQQHAEGEETKHDSRDYIEAAKSLYFSYVSSHPLEAAGIYVRRVNKIITHETSAIGLSLLLVFLSYLLAIRHYFFGALRRSDCAAQPSTIMLSFFFILMPASLIVPSMVNPFMAQVFRTSIVLLFVTAIAQLAMVAMNTRTYASPETTSPDDKNAFEATPG